MTDNTTSHSSIQRLAEFVRPTVFGDFNVVSYNVTGSLAFALTRGEFPHDDLLVRIQSPCLFGESFGVNSCDCGAQLAKALQIGSQESSFLLIYLSYQEGRGLGMSQKIKVLETETNRYVDMVEASHLLGFPLDIREYRAAAEIVKDINQEYSIQLMTNNPKKVVGLEEHGIQINARVPLLIDPPNAACQRYLATKKHKMGHILSNIE